MATKITVANLEATPLEKGLYTALLTLPDRNTPPMEADATYQGCLPFCELHSRSFAVGSTGAYDLEIAHMCCAISGF